MRVLPQRRDPHSEGVSRSEPDGPPTRRSVRRSPTSFAAAARTCACCARFGGMPIERRRHEGARRTGPPGVPQAIGRVDRVLQRDGGRRRKQRHRIGAGDERARQRAARFMDRGRFRRRRDGLHRQVRTGAGPLHGTDAAHRRRARRAARSRDADPVRYRIDARPGDDLWCAVAPCQLQSRQSRAGRGHCTPGLDAAGFRSTWRPGRSPGGPRRRDCGRRRSGAARELCGARRWPEVRPSARPQRHATASRGLDRARQIRPASRPSRDGDRPVRVRAQRAR